MKKCGVVLLGAGRSKRLGFDKILTPIAGKPVLAYSLETFAQAPSVDSIVITTRTDVMDQVKEIAETFGKGKEIAVIEGGKERQDSVFEGIKHLSGQCEILAIHDAARPLITVEAIEQGIEQTRQRGSAVCAHRASDTIKRATNEGEVLETLNRAELWQMQTPQIFKAELVEKAYRYVQENNIPITDDASAVEAFGEKVWLLEVASLNLKITRPTDWNIIEMHCMESEKEKLRPLVHQISNQLNPMIGYVPLLEKHGGKEPKFTEYLGKLKKSTKGLQELLHELQELAHALSPKE